MNKLVTSDVMKMKNQLKLDNWFAFQNELKDCLPLFRDAGKEVFKEHSMKPKEPVRVTKVKTFFADGDKKVEKVRDWDPKVDEEPFLKAYENWKKKMEELEQDRSLLFFFILRNLTPSILQKVKNEQGFEKLQQKNKPKELLKLLKEKVLAAGDNTGAALRQRWQNLSQNDQDLENFLVEFNGYLELLKGTPSAPSAQDEASHYVHDVRMKGENPTLQDAQTKLKRLEEVLKSEAKKRKRGEEEDVSNAPDGIAMRAISTENGKRRRMITNNHDSSRPHGKRYLQQPHRINYTKSSYGPQRCQNCDLAGHTGRQCKRAKTRCNHCGKEGHLEKYCRLKKSKIEKNNGRHYDRDKYNNNRRKEPENDKVKDERAYMISATAGWNDNNNIKDEDIHAFAFMSRSYHQKN
eukprot:scaffold5686_cov171-Ochromonas_danica.AAC.2